MKVNRRDFVRIGTVGTAGVLGLGASCWPHKGKETPSLQIRIQGLCLVERFPTKAKVHLVDGDRVNLGPHQITLTVPASLVVDKGMTVQYLTDLDPHGTRFYVFDLTGKDLTVTGLLSGDADLTFDDGPIPACATLDGVACLPAASSWTSLKYAAHLSTLCGSTRITDRTKFYGSLMLDHGHLQSAIPEDPDGQNYAWTFNMPNAPHKQITQQVMTDTLVCNAPSTSTGTTFEYGPKEDPKRIVLKPGFPTVVTLRNLPPPNTEGMCKGTKPCLDHLEALYDLVDAKFRPTVHATLIRTGPPGVRPNYCPPAI